MNEKKIEDVFLLFEKVDTVLPTDVDSFLNTQSTGVEASDLFQVVLYSPDARKYFNWFRGTTRTEFCGVQLNSEGKKEVFRIKQLRIDRIKQAEKENRKKNGNIFWEWVRRFAILSTAIGGVYAFAILINGILGTEPKINPSKTDSLTSKIHPSASSAILDTTKTDSVKIHQPSSKDSVLFPDSSHSR